MVLRKILPVRNYMNKIKAAEILQKLWNIFLLLLEYVILSVLGFSILNAIFGDFPLLDTNMVVNFLIFYGNLFYRTKLTNHHLLIIRFIMLRKDEI